MKSSSRSGCINTHFARTFLEAQKVTSESRVEMDKIGTSLLKNTRYHCSTPARIFSDDSFSDTRRGYRDIAGSDRSLTRTLHLQNIAPDSQPGQDSTSSSNYDSDLISRSMEDYTNTLTRTSKIKKRDSKKKMKNIRRTQSEAEVNKTPSPKSSFRSFKRALSPFIFKTKKKNSTCEDPELYDVMTKTTPRSSLASIPVVMETGFPATSTTNLAVGDYNTGSYCVRGLVSPLVHPRNATHLGSLKRGALQRQGSIEDPVTSRQENKLTRHKVTRTMNRGVVKVLNKQSSTSLDSVKQQTPVQDRKLIILQKPLDKSTDKHLSASQPLSLNINPSAKSSGDSEGSITPEAKKPIIKRDNSPKMCSECHSVISSSTETTSSSQPDIHSDTITRVDTRPLRDEMMNLLKRYGSSKPGFDPDSLHQKLREVKKELEEYKSLVQNNREMEQLRRGLGSSSSNIEDNKQYNDEVFYKADKEMLDSTERRTREGSEYYKEIEVRINPEGIAVIRRRHRVLPEPGTGRTQNVMMRRSTIHVDDRVFCDKAVLQSIYGHSPTHFTKNNQKSFDFDNKEQQEVASLREKGVTLRPFIHQKSVPNLFKDECQVSLKKNDNVCEETDKLKKEFHKRNFNSSNLPIHKKYIKDYTKFYERKLALKLIDLNRFINEEKAMKLVLDEKIRKSFQENDQLLESLSSTKKDILNMIAVIETPV